ncbi:hypothetical protein ACLKMH_00340 [Psychromonas sp. KJ10-10]|uniref:hypothetical protein n=1 Tax=Psychromonas sp. KJ10-10 TaxID=3391823 RepID=UPI0039B6851D
MEVESTVYKAKVNEALAKLSEAEYKVHVAEVKANEWWTKAIEAEARANEAETQGNEAIAKINDALLQTSNVAQHANEAVIQVSDSLTQVIEATNRASIAEEKAHQAEINLHNIINSSSWKITAPYRFLGRFIKTMLSSVSYKEKLHSIEKSIIFRVKKSNFLRKNTQKLLFKYPKLHRMYLDRVNTNLTTPTNVKSEVNVELQAEQSHTSANDNRRIFNAMERKIYNDIKVSLHKGNE